MNESKILIYQYSSNSDKWYDATNRVVWYKDNGNSWLVAYEGTADFYHVSYRNMKIYDQPIEVSFAELYYKESPCFKVKKLLLFNNCIYKIFYENARKTIDKVDFPSIIKCVSDKLTTTKRKRRTPS